MISSMFRSSAAASKRAFSTASPSVNLNASAATYGGNNAVFIVGYSIVFGSVLTLMRKRFARIEERNSMKGAPHLSPQGLAPSEMDIYKTVHLHQ
jgi:hypothetical protein